MHVSSTSSWPCVAGLQDMMRRTGAYILGDHMVYLLSGKYVFKACDVRLAYARSDVAGSPRAYARATSTWGLGRRPRIAASALSEAALASSTPRRRPGPQAKRRHLMPASVTTLVDDRLVPFRHSLGRWRTTLSSRVLCPQSPYGPTECRRRAACRTSSEAQ